VILRGRLQRGAGTVLLIAATVLTQPVGAGGSVLIPVGREQARSRADSSLAAVETLPIAEPVVFARDVSDPVFGYVIGLLDRGLWGRVTGAHFARAVDQSGRPSGIPHEMISEVRRSPGNRPHSGWVRASFIEPLRVPVPYDILGYHPGSLQSSQVVMAEEWRVPRTQIPNLYVKDGPHTLEIEDLTLWGIVEGDIVMDIDGWLDAFLGNKLDDTYIIGLALFRYDGRRYAMALGFSGQGQGRSGVLDVKRDKICFPASRELKAIGRELRSRVVKRLARRGIPAWVPPHSEGG
jgi:hypothetical protein